MTTVKNKTKEKQPRKGMLERRDRILEAAVEVFAEKGVGQATVDEIAARAGVGKGTIYRRVGRKEDFINLLYQHAAKLTADNIKSAIRMRTDPALQFKEAINALCDVYEKHLNLGILLVSRTFLTIKHQTGKGRATEDSINQVFKLLEDIVSRAVKRGQFRAIDTRAVVKGLISFLNPHTYHEMRFEYNYTRGEIAQLTIDLFLNGLRITKNPAVREKRSRHGTA